MTFKSRALAGFLTMLLAVSGVSVAFTEGIAATIDSSGDNDEGVTIIGEA